MRAESLTVQGLGQRDGGTADQSEATDRNTTRQLQRRTTRVGTQGRAGTRKHNARCARACRHGWRSGVGPGAVADQIPASFNVQGGRADAVQSTTAPPIWVEVKAAPGDVTCRMMMQTRHRMGVHVGRLDGMHAGSWRALKEQKKPSPGR